MLLDSEAMNYKQEAPRHKMLWLFLKELLETIYKVTVAAAATATAAAAEAEEVATAI